MLIAVCRLGLDGAVPNHSTLSNNHYGRFRESDIYRVLLEDVVSQCCCAGLVTSDGFAVDGSLISSDTARTRRVGSVDAIREADSNSRPGREKFLRYPGVALDAIDAIRSETKDDAG